MNAIHNINYSKKEWRILIGHWLFMFMSILFDNWKKLEFINKNYSIRYVEIAKFNKSIFPLKNYNDFAYSSDTDRFNNEINLDLIKFLKNFKVKFIPYSERSNFINSFNIYFYIKIFLYEKIFVILNYVNFVFKNLITNYVVFHRPYFNSIINVLVQIKLKQFPIFYKSPIITINHSLNLKIRKEKLKNFHSKFLNIVSHLFFKYIPLSYIENFQEHLRAVEKINWPKNPRYIFSDNSFYYDDFFKFWLVSKKKLNCKFVCGQHGGGFYISVYNFQETHQYKISDKVVTWGYKNKNCQQLFNYKISGRKVKFYPRGNLLIVNYEISRFSMSSNIYRNMIYSEYLERQLSFIKNINKNIFCKIVFRNFPVNYDRNVSEIVRDAYPNILFDKNKHLYDSLNQSRLCYINLNSTAYLETFSLNFPTIICFDKKIDLVRNDAKKYFKVLEKAGVYYDNHQLAAEKINKIWNNVDEWWSSKKVQSAVAYFCNRYAKRSYNSVNELADFFK